MPDVLGTGDSLTGVMAVMVDLATGERKVGEVTVVEERWIDKAAGMLHSRWAGAGRDRRVEVFRCSVEVGELLKKEEK